MTRLQTILGNPALHVVAGLAFVLAWTWPLLSIETPIVTWSLMYGSWAVSIAACAIFAFGRSAPTEDATLEEGV